MIITVTLNAALDRTLSVPNFRLGNRHRAVDSVTMPGGKGVNVARALKLLGEPVIATGLAGGLTGDRIVTHLTQEEILNDFVRVQGESRTSVAVIDPTSNEQTEIIEPGPVVSENELEMFIEKLLYLARGAEVCIFAGSIPRGVPDSIYASIINELKQLDVLTIVDTYGAPLQLAVRAGPDIVAPNKLEAEELVGHEFHGESDTLSAVREICDMGARDAFITYSGGCYAKLGNTGSEEANKVMLDPLDPVSTIGSGDAFLAGYAAQRYRGSSTEECLRYAVACGAESTQHFGAGIVDQKAVTRLVNDAIFESIKLDEPKMAGA